MKFLKVETGVRVMMRMAYAALAATSASLICGASPDRSQSGASRPDGGVVVERPRDSADSADIYRWYSWSDCDPKRIERKEYVKCEGRLIYDIDIPETGWYVLEQRGMANGWARSIFIDGRAEFDGLTTNDKCCDESLPRHERWYREGCLFLEKGRHALAYERLFFPGWFPGIWRLRHGVKPSDMCRIRVVENVVRVGDTLALDVMSGSAAKAVRCVLTAHRMDAKEEVALGTVAFDPSSKPVVKRFEARLPKQGVWRIRVDGVEDSSAGTVVSVDVKPTAPGTDLVKTLVADIDCVATPPYREVDGTTRIVDAPFGRYRESSGNASNRDWALDGFSYAVDIPDIRHTYLLEVAYPDDTFRSIGFWTNDRGRLDTPVAPKNEGVTLTGGVETGGFYPISNAMDTHEAFFYPTGTNLLIAIINLNAGSRAAASRIRVWRIDGPLPVAAEGNRRGRLAGAFFEEYGRWKRHFGMGNDPNPERCQDADDLRSMERWGEWNRFAGVNLMSPSVVAYLNILYPTKVLSGSNIHSLNGARMLALVAEKYGQRFIPHVYLFGDPQLAKRLGISDEKTPDAKSKTGFRVTPKFRNPDVVEWDKDGKTVVPWRQWAFNCLHPDVQDHVVRAMAELAGMLADTKSFDGISLRVSTGWQPSGLTGLFNADWGYGDWTMREFTKDTGISVPGAAGSPDRFRARYDFLMSDANRPIWLDWRTARIKAFYRRMHDAMDAVAPGRELYINWWPSDQTRDERKATEMKECGVAPDDWRDEKGISIHRSSTALYGRRYFTPRHMATQFNSVFDRMKLKASETGRRATCLYTEYYEVEYNMKWADYGARDGTAFDACAMPRRYERQLYAYALAECDTATVFNGGNGWMFGTPAETEPFMREYLALPPERFGRIAGVADGVVCFRERRTEEGLFVYAVNVGDEPAEVSIDVRGGKVTSAVDGRPAATHFTLEPYGLKSLLVKRGLLGLRKGRVASASAVSHGDWKHRLEPTAEFLRDFRKRLDARESGVDLRADFHCVATNAIATLDDALAHDDPLKAMAAISTPKLIFALDHDGRFPPGLVMSGKGRQVGGWPSCAARPPKLKVSRQFGGDPMERPANGAMSFASDGRRTWAAFEAGGRLQLREFDSHGAYLRSGILTRIPLDWRRYSDRDSRHTYIYPPEYAQGWRIGYSDGALVSGGRAYDVNDGFREIVRTVGREPEPVKTNAKVKFKVGSNNFNVPSRLRAENGKLLVLSERGVIAFNPATGERCMVNVDAASFAVKKDDSLPLKTGSAQSEERGEMPWRLPTDECADGKGLRWIVDRGSDLLVALDAKTGELVGVYGNSGTMDSRGELRFSAPTGVAALDGRLYVMDSGNLRIVEIKVER